MITDRFGTALAIDDIVVQDRRENKSVLRTIVEIPLSGDKVRVGPISYDGRTWEDVRPILVSASMLAKYINQG